MGLFDLFKKKEKPYQPITNEYGYIDRRSIPAEVIDQAQKEEASPKYRKYIISKYYSDFPEKPFISKDRELYTNWDEMAGMFPNSVMKKKNMTRYKDGLLPGHVYMLYWIKTVHRKRIPSYFEYEYGIQFDREKQFLIENGYLDQEGKVTTKGEKAMTKHKKVIEEKSPTYKPPGVDAGPAPAYESKRVIPPDLREGKYFVPESDKKLIKSEFGYINELLERAVKLAKIDVELKINPDLFLYEGDITYYGATPLTPKGKAAKYPLTLYFANHKQEDLDFNHDRFGEIQYLQNGSIGKARLICWEYRDGYFVYLGIVKGVLDIKKVETAGKEGPELIYKAT